MRLALLHYYECYQGIMNTMNLLSHNHNVISSLDHRYSLIVLQCTHHTACNNSIKATSQGQAYFLSDPIQEPI